MVVHERVEKFDYGKDGNMKHYNQVCTRSNSLLSFCTKGDRVQVNVSTTKFEKNFVSLFTLAYFPSMFQEELPLCL